MLGIPTAIIADMPEELPTMTHPALDRLTREEKASLVSGATFWTTETIEHAGIEGATLTDGPHGVRMQNPDTGEDHLGIAQSAPATAFPTGARWDRAGTSRCCSGSARRWVPRPGRWASTSCSGRG
ncbi:hypothetical protein ACF3NT_06460 [Naumannella halotolerans]|uniref:hypothetical protein n=1 Tax=Naumannella halotolerans TaxID=993414 RepID=UPI001AAF5196|nr:hypothetical protein [Naumannella halotolerans]